MELIKPICLLADSQLLFLKNEHQQSYLQVMMGDISSRDFKAAYIGASNGDDPVFYNLFCEAMGAIGMGESKMITSSFSEEEQEFLGKADLILLSGGDTNRGLQVFNETRIGEVIQKKYLEGSLLIGVSAGAMQTGWECFNKVGVKYMGTDALKLVPFIVLVHVEKKDFKNIQTLLMSSKTVKRAYEIPFGAGLIYHPDHTVEAIRKPINEFILKDDKLFSTLIYPINFGQ